MNWMPLFGIFMLAFFLIALHPTPVHGDAEKINVDKTLYQTGDIITITATVGETNSYEPVTVIVRDSNGDFVVLDTTTSDETGAFEMTIDVDDNFVAKGLFSAQMYIDDVASDEIAYFDFSPDGSPVTHTAEESALMESSIIESGLVEKVSAEQIKLVDAFGTEVESVSVNQPVQIATDIVNLVDKNQSFTYIVQVRDIRGAPVHISWFSGMMSDDQVYNVALSWEPETSGSFYADVFVWDSMSDAISLSEPETLSIQVA